MRLGIDRQDATAGTTVRWRSVALPSEHGGWGLTAEPALLGLLVVPSRAGAALAVAAMLAFLVRKPVRLVVVDRWRHRWLTRSAMALRVAIFESAAMIGLVAIAAVQAQGRAWWVPLLAAAPVVAIALWFDARSRSRRLIPEIAGATGISAAAPAIVLAGGGGWAVAGALWIVLGGRAGAAIPFVRAQVARLRHGVARLAGSDVSQAAAVAAAAAAVVVRRDALAGAGALAVLALAHVVWVRRPPPVAMVLGVAETLAGLALVAVTAVGMAVW